MLGTIMGADDDCETIHVDIDAHHVLGGVGVPMREPRHSSHAVCTHAAEAAGVAVGPPRCRFHAAAVAVAPSRTATAATTAISHRA
jgi:hypothetical protein